MNHPAPLAPFEKREVFERIFTKNHHLPPLQTQMILDLRGFDGVVGMDSDDCNEKIWKLNRKGEIWMG